MAHENIYWEDSDNAWNLAEWLERKSGVVTYSYMRLKKTIVTVYLDTSDSTTWTQTAVRRMSLFAILNWQYPVTPTSWNNNFHKFYPDTMNYCTSDGYLDDDLTSFDNNCYFHADSVIFEQPAYLIEDGEITKYFDEYVYPESSSYISKVHRYEIVDFDSNVAHTNLWTYGSGGKLTLSGIHPVVNKNTISPPPTEWMLNNENRLIMPIYRELVNDLGAFNKCDNLTYVEYPESVGSIGKKSFQETKLKAVTLPDNCTFYDTSFPSDCRITYYGGGGVTVDNITDMESHAIARLSSMPIDELEGD